MFSSRDRFTVDLKLLDPIMMHDVFFYKGVCCFFVCFIAIFHLVFVSMICVSHFKATGRQYVCQLSKYSVEKCKYAWNTLMSLLKKKHARFECQKKNMLVIRMYISFCCDEENRHWRYCHSLNRLLKWDMFVLNILFAEIVRRYLYFLSRKKTNVN